MNKPYDTESDNINCIAFYHWPISNRCYLWSICWLIDVCAGVCKIIDLRYIAEHLSFALLTRIVDRFG